MNSVKIVVLVVCMSFALCSRAMDVGVPEGVYTTSVGEQISQNGVPMEIQYFHSAKSVNAVLDFYRDRWGRGASLREPGFVENTVGEWSVISKLNKDSNIAIQIRNKSGGGIEGYISVMALDKSPVNQSLWRDFPLPSGSEVTSETSSVDGDKRATTIILSNALSVESNAEFFKRRLKQERYKLVHDSRGVKERVMFFNGRFNIEVAIGKDAQKTTVFVNIVGST